MQGTRQKIIISSLTLKKITKKILMNNANDVSGVTGMGQITGFAQVGNINYVQLSIGNPHVYV